MSEVKSLSVSWNRLVRYMKGASISNFPDCPIKMRGDCYISMGDIPTRQRNKIISCFRRGYISDEGAASQLALVIADAEGYRLSKILASSMRLYCTSEAAKERCITRIESLRAVDDVIAELNFNTVHTDPTIISSAISYAVRRAHHSSHRAYKTLQESVGEFITVKGEQERIINLLRDPSYVATLPFDSNLG